MATSEDENRNADIDAVIRKIQKLLTRTKGDRGQTDEEADTAMKIVQGLMAKYNLDMATIDAAGSSNADAGSVRVDEKQELRARFKWQRELAKYVAEANFCLYVLVNERVKGEDGLNAYAADGRKMRKASHRFIGRKNNVITTRLMFDYLCRAIEEQLPIENKTERFSKASSSWKEGCSAKLCERLAERRKDLMAEHDAKVKAEQDAFAKDLERRKREHNEKAARQLGPRAATAEEIIEELGSGAYVRTGMKSSAPSEEDVDRPEIEEDDWTPGANAEEVVEEEPAPPVTTLVLSSVYDTREQELNNDLRMGWEPGSTTKRRIEREERSRKWREQYDAEDAARAARIASGEEKEPEVEVETERQKARRLAREEKEYQASRKRWAREDDREMRRRWKEQDRVDMGSYKAGMKTGEKIGLDPQIKARADAKRLGG